MNQQRAFNLFEDDAVTYENDKVPKITTLECHTAGEPLRIIIDGLPQLPAGTVLEKRRYFMQHYDQVRKALLCEPRGHADQYASVLTKSDDTEADVDVIFLNTEGYSPMCGHGIIAIAKVLLDMNFGRDPSLSVDRVITMNTPAGRNYARGETNAHGTIERTYFKNVASFVYLQDATVEVPGIGSVAFSIAFGGVFYAIVDVPSLSIEPPITLTSTSYSRLISLGRAIKSAITAKFEIKHPFEPDLSSLFGVMLVGPSVDGSGHHSRNVNVFEDGIVDRSPTGTGISARAALMHAKGQLKIGERIEIESIIGTLMTVEAVEETKFGGYNAIVPEVGGKAYVMGKAEWWFDPNDSVGEEGFVLR